MIDLKYAKACSYLDGQDAKAREMVKFLLEHGASVSIIAKASRQPEAENTLDGQPVLNVPSITKLKIPVP